MGVTKYVGIEEAQALVAAGCADLGESRPQELWRKAEALLDELRPESPLRHRLGTELEELRRMTEKREVRT